MTEPSLLADAMARASRPRDPEPMPERFVLAAAAMNAVAIAVSRQGRENYSAADMWAHAHIVDLLAMIGPATNVGSFRQPETKPDAKLAAVAGVIGKAAA